MHSNKYKKWYDALIEQALHRERPSGYIERHHIIPKSLGGSNSKTNLVALTAKEHYVAHLLLYRMHTGVARRSMVRALVRFATKCGRSFELARIIIARESFGKNNTSFGKRWSHNPTTLEVSYSRDLPMGNQFGLPSQRGGSEKGWVWINNGFEESICDAKRIPAGWRRGRLRHATHEQLCLAAKARHTPANDIAHSAKLKGRVSVLNPDTGKVKRIAPSELEHHLSSGWVTKGRKTKLSISCRVNGTQFETLADAARELGISTMTLSYRLKSANVRWKDWLLT